MTEEQKAALIAERVEKHEKAIEDRKKQEIKDGFLNPFGEETSYKEFLEVVAKEKTTVEDYCKGHLTEDQIAWLKKDLAIFENKKKK